MHYRKFRKCIEKYYFIIKRMMVDEADIDLVGGSSSQTGGRGAKRPAESPNPIPFRPSKRKAGPLPRDLYIRRPFSPLTSTSPSPPPSPMPMLLGDMEIRPDSPLPSVHSPIFPSPIIGRVDSEDESDSLVIEDYGIDPTADTSLLNGTSKCALTEDTPTDHQIVASSPVQVMPGNGNVISPDTLASSSTITNHLVNGDIKGISLVL
jgi:integrator complex subunit 6